MGEGACKSAFGWSTVDNLHSSTAAVAYANGSDGNGPLPAFVGRGIVSAENQQIHQRKYEMQITEIMLKQARTKKGGYTLKQVEMAIALVGSPWIKPLQKADVDCDWWRDFYNAQTDQMPAPLKVKPKAQIVNPMPPDNGDWCWKPKSDDIPKVKIAGKKPKTKKKKRKIICRKENQEFYDSKEWRELRVRVLEKHECKCMMCGRSPKTHGVVVHVDHIKPRSKHPELSLEFTNLQLLCEDCNLGKGNKYETDWRPNGSPIGNANN